MPGTLFVLVILVLTGLCCGLSAGLVLARVIRRRSRSRRARLLAALRPLVLTLTAGEGEDPQQAARELVDLDARRWGAVHPTVLRLLVKLRGESHAGLVQVLDRRGTLFEATGKLAARRGTRRADAAHLLGISAHTAALPEVLRLLTDPAPQVRQVATRALGRLADPAAVRPLFETLDGDRLVPARLVANAVTRIGLAAHPVLPEVLVHGGPSQRSTAAEVAGLVGAAGCLTELIRTVGQTTNSRSGSPRRAPWAASVSRGRCPR